MIKLAPYRKAAGLSQLEIARSLGVSQRRTIGAWENDPKSMTIYKLEAYARVCGVTVADLLGYDGAAISKLNKIRELIE